MEINFKKYFIVLIITVTIFATAFYASSFFYNQRIEEIKKLENRVALNFLALEIEADLLAGISCETEYAFLAARDLQELGDKLTYLETQSGRDKEIIQDLKMQYSLFQLKDYLFLRQWSKKCNKNLDFVFYFYSNKGDCEDCTRQGYVLTKLRNENPNLRIYSFDYNLDIPGVNTLKRFYGIENNLPALVVNRRLVYGFQNEEKLLNMIFVPEI